MTPQSSDEANEPTNNDSTRQPRERHSQGTPDDRQDELDQIFEVLSNRRRRAIFQFLNTEALQVRMGELAEMIAASECDKDRSQLTAQERKRVYIGLYQNHLPKMDGVDAIDYDEQSGQVERGPTFDAFVEHLPAEE